jgi:phage-related protein
VADAISKFAALDPRKALPNYSKYVIIYAGCPRCAHRVTKGENQVLGHSESWSVEFYVTAGGKAPAKEFIDGLPARERAKVARALEWLRDYGQDLGMPHARPIEGKLWELRAGAGRLFYFVYTGRRIILLHGYLKKSQRSPRREIEVALRRMADFLGGD